jgi:hypothetical protein
MVAVSPTSFVWEVGAQETLAGTPVVVKVADVVSEPLPRRTV